VKAGVLALQGDFREHGRMLAAVGATPLEVRDADELAGVDCLVIPGGESTTIVKLAPTISSGRGARRRRDAGLEPAPA
jgi:5'-phosphate synthase pdxT subunit